MKLPALVVGLLAAFSVVPANATVVFSTLHTPATANSTRLVLPNSGTSGSVPRGGPIGESFYVPVATAISSVSLQLTANTPTDGASVLIYVVPNVGGSAGVAGLPKFTGTGLSLSLTNAVQIGSILDSALPNTAAGALFTFNTYQPVAAGEYWLVAGNTLGTGGVAGTAKWVFDTTSYTNGIGTAGQDVFWQAGATGSPCAGAPCTFSDTHVSSIAADPGTNNLYIAAVTVPEPFSIALLAAGLTGLGIVRRRGHRG